MVEILVDRMSKNKKAAANKGNCCTTTSKS